MTAGPNQLWSWDITYLPTSVRGVWLYLYLVVDVCVEPQDRRLGHRPESGCPGGRRSDQQGLPVGAD